jgi:lysophospholipase L1-like esterase
MLSYPGLPYYAAQDWTDTYWQEAKLSERYQYQPYVVWRHLPFEGETIHINQEGIRFTPGADCDQDSYTVFTFGGSTMLGWGAPDWGTIPAYLQAGLGSLVSKPVCVLNLAEDGFVSTQSLIALIRELQSGNVPDMVVFYDGVNEVIAAYESGEPDAHVTLAKIAGRFEEPANPLFEWFKGSRVYSLIGLLAGKLTDQGQEGGLGMFSLQVAQTDRSELADTVAEIYLGNYRIVDVLSQEYGFEYSFFVQPHLAVSEKPLTPEEQALKSKMEPALASLAEAVYANIASAVPDHEYLWFIADALDEERAQIWIDQWGHITPEGNRLVAREILASIGDQLAEK